MNESTNTYIYFGAHHLVKRVVLHVILVLIVPGPLLEKGVVLLMTNCLAKHSGKPFLRPQDIKVGAIPIYSCEHLRLIPYLGGGAGGILAEQAVCSDNFKRTISPES